MICCNLQENERKYPEEALCNVERVILDVPFMILESIRAYSPV